MVGCRGMRTSMHSHPYKKLNDTHKLVHNRKDTEVVKVVLNQTKNRKWKEKKTPTNRRKKENRIGVIRKWGQLVYGKDINLIHTTRFLFIKWINLAFVFFLFCVCLWILLNFFYYFFFFHYCIVVSRVFPSYRFIRLLKLIWKKKKIELRRMYETIYKFCLCSMYITYHKGSKEELFLSELGR